MFKKASKKKSKLRLALTGPSGSGKTYTALSVASGIGDKIAVLDSESHSAALYANDFNFDVECLDGDFHVSKYVAAIKAAEEAGYDVIILDSLSAAWEGSGGILATVDKAASKMKGNTFMAWSKGTPEYNSLVQAILTSKIHVIATMRSKTAYDQQDKNGKKIPVKVGLAPVQRGGIEYEFTIVGEMDTDHDMTVSKTRYSGIADRVITKPGKKFGQELVNWLNDGEERAGDSSTLSDDEPALTFEEALKVLSGYKKRYGERYENAVKKWKPQAIKAGDSEEGVELLNRMVTICEEQDAFVEATKEDDIKEQFNEAGLEVVS